MAQAHVGDKNNNPNNGNSSQKATDDLDYTKPIYYSDSYFEKIKNMKTFVNDAKKNNNDNSDNSDLIQFMADFDHTMTSPTSLQCHHFLYWHIPIEAFRKEIESLFDFKNIPRDQPFHVWYEKYNDATIKHKIEKWMVDDCVKKALANGKDRNNKDLQKTGVKLRSGLESLIDFTDSKDIPYLIVSSGIVDIINQLLEHFKINKKNVSLLSNEINWSPMVNNSINNDDSKDSMLDNNNERKDRRVIESWPSVKPDDKAFLSWYNKDITYDLMIKKTNWFATDDIKKRKLAVFLGDQDKDVKTVNCIPDKEINQCLMIGFVTKRVKKVLSKFLDKFDIVINDESDVWGNDPAPMEPVITILKDLIDINKNYEKLMNPLKYYNYQKNTVSHIREIPITKPPDVEDQQYYKQNSNNSSNSSMDSETSNHSNNTNDKSSLIQQNKGHSTPAKSTILKNGWMGKKGVNYEKYNNRYFILAEETLFYYETEQSSQAQDFIDLKGLKEINKHGNTSFYLVCPHRTWEFLCSTEDERDDWCQKIRQVSKAPLKTNKP